MSLELDIPSLLSPIDGEMRAGTDLRLDDDPNNDYRQIRDARTDAREPEQRGEDFSPDSVSSWRDVWSWGQNYLQSHAKDLEIVAYMIEASIRLGGYRGFEQALTLTHDLIDEYWGELLPTPDEDGIETTLLPIARLNSDAISYALSRVAVTDDTSVGEFVLWQFADAKRMESMDAEERQVRIERGAVSLSDFNRAVAESSDQFYRDLYAEIESAQTAVKALDDILTERAEDEAPNLSRFRQGLEDAAATIRTIAGDRLAVEDAATDDIVEDGAADSSESAGSSQSGGSGAINNRNDALDQLERIAQWFERNEPQSILIPEIRKVRRRAMMSPEDLYKDLIDDSTVRNQLFRDIGIETSSDDEYDN
ncbi:MAG TPA: type VI secretion system protein TssA [Planctomycetaceae bacterium]|nr:type VI secretion system protein TssA [Planctomycetaceae bacterium]